MSGCDFEKPKFTVFNTKRVSGKRCFKNDCENEGDTCSLCMMIQGKWIHYKPKIIDAVSKT